jgi:hypothetical protein
LAGENEGNVDDLRIKLLEDRFTAEELVELLQKENWEDLVNLQGDEWRDWVDALDWEKLGEDDLVNLIFKSIANDLCIEQLHYFGVSVNLNMVSHPKFSRENQILLSTLLIEIAKDLETYGDFFLETCDEFLVADWLNLYQTLSEKIEDLEETTKLKNARKILRQFFVENFE